MNCAEVSDRGVFLVALGVAGVVELAAVGVLVLLVWRGVAPGLRRVMTRHPWRSGLVGVVVALVVALIANAAISREASLALERDAANLRLQSNLLCSNPPGCDLWASQDTLDAPVAHAGSYSLLKAQTSISSTLVAVRPGATYHFRAHTSRWGQRPGKAQARILWLDRAQDVLAWDDTAPWQVDNQDSADEIGMHSGTCKAPPGVAWLRLELRNLGPGSVAAASPKVSQDGVYLESHPNGARGALAFSFDWESAMGGAVHSKGMEAHDAASAGEHGMEMRRGADWLADLFAQRHITATFYATGYNLLDGNTQRRTFSGNPVYKWAGPKNGWQSDWWLTHPWYGDDPYGTVQSDPAWYFGDQTRRLLKVGHEVAPHTFGHLYVRGSNPRELATDMDEWLAAAKSAGMPPASTFAFPWRSSNSLTPDFYDALYERGIRAVTRVYEKDLKDLYTLGAVSVYSDVAVMPDFLLGVQSANAGEEAAGREISADEGLRVITETLTRRGTTSFWQHPEQLTLPEVQQAWRAVTDAAATERDKGRLWIDTVANITAYQRAVMSVTATLDLEQGGWKIHVSNALDRPISGLTLTMPGGVARATSSRVVVSAVVHARDGAITLGTADRPVSPFRQLVLRDLQPGASTIDIEWATGEEPVR